MDMAELPDQSAVKHRQHKEKQPHMQAADAPLKAEQKLDESHDIAPIIGS
jgi:hypothetical protein